jgi:hypothetical protein
MHNFYKERIETLTLKCTWQNYANGTRIPHTIGEDMFRIKFIVLALLVALTSGILYAQDSENEACSPAGLATLIERSYATFNERGESAADSVAYLQAAGTFRDTLSEIIDGCAEVEGPDDGSAGTGTFPDPFRFGISGNVGNGLVVKVVGLLRPADSIIRGYNPYNDRPGANQEYVIVKLEVFCEEGGSSSCDTNYFDYSLVGNKGVVYDFASVVDDNKIDVEIFPGATGSGEIAFLIDSTDSDLKLIYSESFGSSDGVFFEAEPSKDSGLEITATSNVNIRSSASTNAGVVGSLAPNTPVLAFGRNQDGTWLQTASGWVFADLVNVDGDIQQLPVTSD